MKVLSSSVVTGICFLYFLRKFPAKELLLAEYVVKSRSGLVIKVVNWVTI